MYAQNDRVKIWYEIHGKGEPTLVLVPGFQIVHSETFKRTYVPHLSRHMRVVTLDLRGNGKSDKPDAGYDIETYAEDIHAVVEAAGLNLFTMAGLSLGAPTVIKYQATHPGRVSNLILLSGFASRLQSEDYPLGRPREEGESLIQIWQDQPESMLKVFIEMACSEQYSLRNKELVWKWAHDTLPEMWGKCFEAAIFSDVKEHLQGINIPVLIIHGQDDRLVPSADAEYLHENIPSSTLIITADSGHSFLRTWPQVSCNILNFLKPEKMPSENRNDKKNVPKILWISSPIGLGHVKRDLAIAAEIRKKLPGVTIHWLSVNPVRSVLEGLGEQIHPLSDYLMDESGHFESHGKSYSLDATEAYWDMEKLLNNNCMVFRDAASAHQFDLVVGDESWEVVDYLHYNPSLKTAPFVFITDFIGASNVSDDEVKRAHVNDVNGTWVDIREKNPEASDLSIFIGEPDDIPDTELGEQLPNRRKWAKKYFEFSGYVLPFDPAAYLDRELIRKELGISVEDKLLLVAIGGTSVGQPLIEKLLQGQQFLVDKIPDLHTIVLCGPRINSEIFGIHETIEFKPFVPDPIQYYCACDLAVIQGGLSTTMELTALGRPFIYFPLQDHFEQQEFVPYRLQRYRAGVRMDFEATDPEGLADAIAENIGKSVNYKSVNTDGAERAATMILEILNRGDS
jgi:pimeloyl-ACP methyl ester carboxylesterase/predicted glycosyltransferase